ncbi:hypothetical protein AYO44_06950 [Planctomycetaceae bacterium SCGC AG-212-F19]|nr:hypothetical protein AYO44_06950 [Planctomycetaceae bacterium SCGC AG-212-F19]
MIVDRQGRQLPKNRCVMVDHHIQTFQVTVRAPNPISEATLKEMLERRYEVTGIQEMNRVSIAASLSRNAASQVNKPTKVDKPRTTRN